MRDVIFFERDPYAPIRHAYAIKEVLYYKKSKYQEILVVDTEDFGKLLILDGVVQLDERFEFTYHEFLAHVPLFAHQNPRSVLIIGGGDGGTLREVLKHKCVERVVLVDIDEEVIKVSKRFFPTLSSGFSDSRVIVLNEDGYEFVKKCEAEFDVVIVDSTDPVGFAHALITEDFFRYVFRALKEDGIYVGQTESLYYHLELLKKVQKSLREVFPITDLYAWVVPIYAGYWWSFSVGSKKFNPREVKRKVDVNTKFYSEELHKHCFLPKNFYKKIMSEEFKL